MEEFKMDLKEYAKFIKFDLKGLVNAVIVKFVLPKLKAFVEKTTNKIDDGLYEKLAEFLLQDEEEGEDDVSKKEEKEVKGTKADQAAEKAGIKLNKDPEKDTPAQLEDTAKNANDGQGVQSVSKSVQPG